MLHTKFRQNRPTHSWKKENKVFTINDGILGHVTSIIFMKANIQNLVENGASVS